MVRGETRSFEPVRLAGSPPRERFIALDSLRGLAALVIVFYHMGDTGWIAGLPPLRVGWMLVDFFFVLSGFVIAASYGARLAAGYPRVGFLLVRFGRIYPLHGVMIVVFVLLEFLVFRPLLLESHPLDELARGVFLLDAFRTGTGNFYAPVSWAVAVEMVLYACAALLFGRGRWAIALALVVAAASAWALHSGFNVPGFGRLLQRGLLGFALGAGGYALYSRLRGVEPGTLVLTLAELALLGALLWLLWQPGNTAATIPLCALLYAAMVLVFARDGGLASRVLQMRPLVWLGQMSFAIYMVHAPFIVLGNRLLPRLFAATGHDAWVASGRHMFGFESVVLPPFAATGLTLLVIALVLPTAWLAWRFVEEPARHWTKRFSPQMAQGGN